MFILFLGGVFIATLFGLALAMVTLIGEVIYYKRKGNKINVKDTQKMTINKKDGLSKSDTKIVTFGTTFKPIKKSNVSYISVYPRPPIHPEKGFDMYLN